MLLRTVYTVTPSGRADVPGVNLPLEIGLAESVWARLEQGSSGLRLVVDRRVDRDALEVVPESGVFREHPYGSLAELPALRIRVDERPEHVLAVDLLSAISFLSDVSLSVSRPIDEDRFVAEDEGDRETLADLGTDDVYNETGFTFATHTFGGVALTAERFSNLLRRRAGSPSRRRT
jgi:hypothetical protein